MSLSRAFGATLVSALFLAVTVQAQNQTFEFDTNNLYVGNLVGEVAILGHDGSDFIVKVAVEGDDAREGLIEFDATDDALKILFPIGKSRSYVYPEMGRRSNMNTTGYSKSGWTKKRGGLGLVMGRKVKVSGSGRGMELWADVTILVPENASLKLKHGVGLVGAVNVDGDLVLDSHVGEVLVERVDGNLTVDTGSGNVDVAGVNGDEVSIDTGSGRVTVMDAEGDRLIVDTGSGSVDIQEVDVEVLHVDTGSGKVTAARVSADNTNIDTGSGAVTLRLDRMGQGNFKIDTGSGSIKMYVPTDADALFHADTGSGGIRIDLEDADILRKKRDEARFSIGNGASKVELDSGSGSILVAQE